MLQLSKTAHKVAAVVWPWTAVNAASALAQELSENVAAACTVLADELARHIRHSGLRRRRRRCD